MSSKKLLFDNYHGGNDRRAVFLVPNDINIIVGRNGHGKTSFMTALEDHVRKKKNCIVLSWNDNEYGRSNGMSKMAYAEDYEGVASMFGVSEGQRMWASIGRFFISRSGAIVRRKPPGAKYVYLLADQVDSGLDVHQINELKKVFRELIIPDMNKLGLTVFVIMSANSFEMVVGEDCIDPVTRSHTFFDTLEEYIEYIDDQYKWAEQEGDE